MLRYYDGDGGDKDCQAAAAACQELAAQTYVILRQLIQNLAQSFTCFGYGPRWRADCVSSLFTVPFREGAPVA